MPSEHRTPGSPTGPPADQRGADEGDPCREEADFHRRVLSANRAAPGPSNAAGENARLLQWADRVGLLLKRWLIPFDVIPCHPTGGFLAFFQDTLAAGHRLHAVTTSPVTPTPARPANEPPLNRQ